MSTVGTAGHRTSAAPRTATGPRLVLEGAADGRPRLALTLVLERQPLTDEPDLGPLVVRGVVAMTLALVPEEGRPSPVVRSGTVRLVVPARGVVASATVGAGLSTVLDGSVDGTTALALLEALQGSGGALVEHDLLVADDAVTSVIGLRGRWIDVWDALRARAEHGRLATGDLESVARLCLAEGRVEVTVDGGSAPVPPATEAAVELLADVARLTLTTPEVTDLGSIDRLRRRPSPLMPLAVEEERTVAGSRSVRGQTRLARLVGAEPGPGPDLDALVRLVAFDPRATGTRIPVAPVPRTTAPTRARRGRRDELVMIAQEPLSVQLMLSDAQNLGAGSAATAYDRLVLQPELAAATVATSILAVSPGSAVEPGPILGDGPLLADHADPVRRWYVPEYRVRLPEPGASPASSPYLFSLATAGVTSGPVPMVGLDATIRVTLDPVMGDATRTALAELGDPAAEPVAVTDVTASLEIPYRLEGSSEVGFHTLTGTVVAAPDGSIVLTVRALDHVARLSYGSLAYEGFQAAPPAVTVRFSFTAWQRTGARGSRAVTVVRHGPARDGLARDRLLDGGLIGDRLLGPPVKPQPSTKPGTPWWEIVPGRIPLEPWEVVEPTPAPTWVQVFAGHATRVPVLLPCSQHPELYRQVGADRDQALGCQDALRLGEAAPPAYADVPGVATDNLRVLRSLQQPGRFVVVPAAFRITRLRPEAGDRAYRPAVLVHAALGGADGDRYVITASLGPALAAHEWNALRLQLRALCPPGVEPQLQLPLDPTLRADAVDRWTVPDDIATPVVTRTWDGFQVVVSAGLTDGLLLNAALETTGVVGEVTFTIGDTTLRSTLVLDTDVVGPWPGGPLTGEVSGDTARVANHSERTADVTEIVDRTGTVVGRLDAPLAPGETADVPVANGGGGELLAVHRLRAAKLTIEQISTYVSDVTTTMSVLNLVNFANHAIARLDVEVRTADGHVQTQEVPEAASVDYPLTFPLTGYLTTRTVELRARTSFADGHAEDSPWGTWDLSTRGNVVSLTSQLIGLSPS